MPSVRSTIHPYRSKNVHLPKAIERDRVFKTCGVDSFLKNYSNIKKNNLYSFAGSAPVDRLSILFPDIPVDKLTELRVYILRNEPEDK